MVFDDLIIGKPSGTLITSLKHRISFIYFEYARIVKNDNSLMAISGDRSCDIPAANLVMLMLGPGTSITHDALSELSRWNCSVAITAGDGLGLYSALNTSSGSNAKFVLQQAKIVSDPVLRLDAARKMYAIRWSDAHFPPDVSLKTLMAFEGRRMKSVYRENAEKFDVPGYRRVTNVDFSGDDLVNQLITSGNAMLYGIVNAVVVGLGASPALGFIHHGNTRAFVFDIADFYKESLVIPTAFELVGSGKDHRDLRRVFRKNTTSLKLIPDIVDKIYHVLGLDDRQDDDLFLDANDVLGLWSIDGVVWSNGNSVKMGIS